MTPETRARDPNDVLERSAALLGQGAVLAAVLPIERFRAVAPGTESGTVGAHLRHCIEFYRSLLTALETGELDYDLRPRELTLERDPALTAAALHQLVRDLNALIGADFGMPLRVRHDYQDENEPWSRSSLGRELNFLLSHTVHHYALIALHLHRLGFPLPTGFGVSPATLRYRAQRRDVEVSES